MTTSMHRIINLSNDQITEIKFTDAELKAYESENKAEQEKIDAKAKAKAALLERLGITAEEAALLLG